MELPSLGQLLGRPARVTLARAGGAGAPPIRVHGVVHSVQTDQLTLAVTEAWPIAGLPERASLEVIMPDGLISFDSEVTQPGGAHDRLVVLISVPEGLRWVQRREHVRLSVQIPCRVVIEPAGLSTGPLPGTIQNLSAGGLALATAAPLTVGDRCSVHLPAILRIADPLSAEVYRVEAAGPDGHLAAMRFLPHSPAQQAALGKLLHDLRSGRAEGLSPLHPPEGASHS